MASASASAALRPREPGTTVLADGTPVSKCDLRVAAIGDLDEVRCAVRLLAALLQQAGVGVPALHAIEQDLAGFGRELGTPGRSHAVRDWITALDQGWAQAPGINIGNAVAAAQARVCRAVCRRAERTVVDLSQSQVIGQALQPYLDRLADLMLLLAERLETPPAPVQARKTA